MCDEGIEKRLDNIEKALKELLDKQYFDVTGKG